MTLFCLVCVCVFVVVVVAIAVAAEESRLAAAAQSLGELESPSMRVCLQAVSNAFAKISDADLELVCLHFVLYCTLYRVSLPPPPLMLSVLLLVFLYFDCYYLRSYALRAVRPSARGSCRKGFTCSHRSQSKHR